MLLDLKLTVGFSHRLILDCVRNTSLGTVQPSASKKQAEVFLVDCIIK